MRHVQDKHAGGDGAAGGRQAEQPGSVDAAGSRDGTDATMLSSPDLKLRRSLAAANRALVRERRSRASAERAKHVRDEMLALIAHDLRSPLNTITMAAEMLLGGRLEATTRPYVEAIERSAVDMSHLVNDLLDVSAIEAGAFRIDPRPVTVEALFERLRGGHALIANDAGVTLRCSASAHLPRLHVDPERLHQVLSNLVNNAFKALRQGGRVDVVARRAEEGIEIVVRDSGPGMDADMLSHAFDRFWHSERAGRAGTGLGLYICKSIVEAHRGRIEVESTPGAGTTFHVVLPV